MSENTGYISSEMWREHCGEDGGQPLPPKTATEVAARESRSTMATERIAWLERDLSEALDALETLSRRWRPNELSEIYETGRDAESILRKHGRLP